MSACVGVSFSVPALQRLFGRTISFPHPSRVGTFDVTSYACHTALTVAIKSWACERSRKIFDGESPDFVPRNLLKRANMKLLMLDAATDLRDLRSPPANRLEKLHGDREGQYSLRINRQYRVCFVWRGGDAYHVEIVDYH